MTLRRDDEIQHTFPPTEDAKGHALPLQKFARGLSPPYLLFVTSELLHACSIGGKDCRRQPQKPQPNRTTSISLPPLVSPAPLSSLLRLWSPLPVSRSRLSSPEASWIRLRYSLPDPDASIVRAWSAGARLLVLVANSRRPFHPGRLFLWDPISNALSVLPSFSSIWHPITFGFGGNIIVAAGFDSNIQCVIEVYHVDHSSSGVWTTIGHLPLTYNVQQHDEILFCNGCFYVLCMESAMLTIETSTSTLSLHDIPCPSSPKLISTCEDIFMIEEHQLCKSFVIWKFNKTESQWHAHPVDCPYLEETPSTVIAIRGIGMLICFILFDLRVLMYDVLNNIWRFVDECPFPPTSDPLLWEPRLSQN
ncbi:hypothetical protein KP509_01G011800 [Ceratopteris richardii]|uniref:KIB1-4 beta-propeller domain-containing protein n=1 Tax=Ceratopteris richardii TaxID=49495 RepID=A0A8T2VM21_CERRI|nr:hypothetical protein KP509_01G011800 [Ceratopteris richardii]